MIETVPNQYSYHIPLENPDVLRFFIQKYHVKTQNLFHTPLQI